MGSSWQLRVPRSAGPGSCVTPGAGPSGAHGSARGRRRPVETTSPTAGAARAAVDTLMKPTPTRNWEDVRRAVQLLAVSMRPNVSALTWRRRSRRTPEAPFPLMDLCVAALKLRRVRQDADRERTGNAWTETRLVFTTRHGMPIEPRGPRKKLGQWLGG